MSCALLILLLAAPSETSGAAATATRTLTLAQAVELAMQTTPEVRAARVGTERTELGVLRAQLDRVSLKVDAQLQELWVKSSIGRSTDEDTDLGLGLSNASANLTVPLFSGLRVESNVDRARDLEAAAGFDLEEARRSTALAVARSYWSVRRVALLSQVQASALERLRNAEEIAAARVSSGLAAPIDENRARARRLLQEATLADLAGQLAESNAQLAVALGLEEEIVLLDPPNAPPSIPPPVQVLLERARAGRPQLASAKKLVDAQEQAIDMAQSAYYPQLSAFSLFQYGNNTLLAGVGSRELTPSANPFSNVAGDFQVGAILSINLFDTLNTYTAVEDARYEQQRLEQEVRRVGRIVEAEVRTARAKVVHIFAVRSLLVPAEEVARDNVDIIQKRYENGDALVFELLDAEIELLDIERRLAESASELTLAWLELDASLGAVVGEQ